MSTNIPSNNATQLERGTAHPIGSTGFNKTDSHHSNTHPTTNYAKEGMHANTGAGDTYGHSDTIVKTGQYPTGLENNTTAVPLRDTAHLPSSVSDRNHQPNAAGMMGHNAAHLPAGNAVPIVGGQQNVMTGVSNVPTSGPQMQNTVPNAAKRDGLVVNDGLGGPLGGAVVLGGQCECLANGGSCTHGAGRCVCRGCTTQATTVNPGINVGVSTAQYTAPAGTSGFGGGVADKGTGIAGLVQPNMATTTGINNTHQGLTGTHHTGHGLTGHHTTGHHTGTATAAGAVAGASAAHHASRNVDGDGHHGLGGHHNTTGLTGTNTGLTGTNTGLTGTNTTGTNTMGTNSQSNTHSNTRAPEYVIAGSEYASGNIDPSHVHRGAQPVTRMLANDQSMNQPINRSSAASPGPITDNSNPDVFLSPAVGTGLPGTNTYGTHGSRVI